jgi:hypothetical protein
MRTTILGLVMTLNAQRCGHEDCTSFEHHQACENQHGNLTWLQSASKFSITVLYVLNYNPFQVAQQQV